MSRVVPASVAETYERLHDGTPGRIRYYRFGDEAVDGPPAGLLFSCPCGCDQVGSIAFRRHVKDGVEQPGPVWIWDGNRELPTCTPSIGFYGANDRKQGYHWHGFLTAGEFREC